MYVAMELRKNKIEKRGKFSSLVGKSSVQKFKSTIFAATSLLFLSLISSKFALFCIIFVPSNFDVNLIFQLVTKRLLWYFRKL